MKCRKCEGRIPKVRVQAMAVRGREAIFCTDLCKNAYHQQQRRLRARKAS